MLGFLRNPGFELSDQDWTKGTGWSILNDVNARNGDWVARAVGGGAGALLSIASFSVRPGLKIAVDCWQKQTGGADFGPTVRVRWLDKDDATITSSSSPGGSSGNTSYENLVLAATAAPARAKAARILIETGTDTTGTMYADDFTVDGEIVEDLPANAVIRSSRIINARTLAAFEPMVGDRKFSDFNAGASDRWAGVYTFIPQLGTNLDELSAFLTRLGRLERFFAFDPRRVVPAGGVVNGMVVDGANQLGTLIHVRAGPVSSTPLKASENVEIAAQYYTLLRDLELGPEGTGILNVWPSVRTASADGEDIITDHPKIVARITSDFDARQLEARPTEFSIAWQEAL